MLRKPLFYYIVLLCDGEIELTLTPRDRCALYPTKQYFFQIATTLDKFLPPSSQVRVDRKTVGRPQQRKSPPSK